MVECLFVCTRYEVPYLHTRINTERDRDRETERDRERERESSHSAPARILYLASVLVRSSCQLDTKGLQGFRLLSISISIFLLY